MSGSSNSNGVGVGRREVNCEDLSFTTQLVTPQGTALAALSNGQELQISIVRRGTEQVLAALANGTVVGVLIGESAARLRECILAGHSYVATVTRVNGPQVTVDVEHS